MSENRDNIFAAAIKILENPSLDYRALVFSMASISPESLIRAVAEVEATISPTPERLKGELMSGLEAHRERLEINSLKIQGKPIDAIKRLRRVARIGQKEAKNIVDSITSVHGVPTNLPMYAQEEEPIW